MPYISNYMDILAGVMVVVITPLLLINVKHTSKITQVLSAVNIIAILVIIIVGMAFVDFSLWTNPATGGFLPYGWSGMFQAAGNAFYAFVGFENISGSAEETRNPNKTLPIALLSVVLIAAVTYMAISATLTLMVPYKDIDVTYSIANAFQV